MQEFERLGLFYLGRDYDIERQAPTDDLLLYESRDLVTHAVCVGMTGSGKTGLCICLLEEALIDGIPALVIDPKGDIANLALTFPELRPEDFAPWVNADDAARKSLTVDEFAADQAQRWRTGLADWGQTPERIARLRAAGDVAVYTPGSTAGLQLSIIKSFSAPPPEIVNDAELLREQIQSTVDSLLGLLGIKSDPLHGREQILLSLILDAAWKQGVDIQLEDLVRQIQSPPVERVGAVDLETFYPAKDRFELSLRLNNLVASPGFEMWLQGDPVDMQSLLYTPEGKPRVAIVSIAHLSDAERMFVVSLLYKQVLAWMRRLPGTTALRALVYMDEVAGYFPPVQNPPSKTPMLTLLKQGRAFGIGAVMATQNPVDLDYKGLANAGTWFLGRLQTERDKARVLDGLEGAAASSGTRFNRGEIDRMLSALSARVFLLNNVHAQAPSVFQVRWALSYLRGPMTRDEIQRLMADQKAASAAASQQAVDESTPANSHTSNAPTSGKLTSRESAPAAGSASRPVLPPEVPEFFFPPRRATPPGAVLTYQPAILATADVHFQQARTNIDTTLQASGIRLAEGDHFLSEWEWLDQPVTERDLDREPSPDARFAPLPTEANRSRSVAGWTRQFSDAAYRAQRLELFDCPRLKVVSQPGESERDFRIRLRDLAHERRDAEVERLHQRMASRTTTLADRVRRAEQAVDRQREQASQHKLQSWMSVGANILGAFLSSKRVSVTNVSRAERSLRGLGRNRKQDQDVVRAEENLDALRQQLEELEQQLVSEIDRISAEYDPDRIEIEPTELRPRKSDVNCRLAAVVWFPHWIDASGQAAPGW